MPKYKITIAEIEQPDPGAGYDKQTVIYDQTLPHLDVAKVVIAANECLRCTPTNNEQTNPDR